MAIVTYLCDTCDRQIDLPQNKKGLEVVQRCIITDGCRGKLSQIKFQQDYLRGEYPAAVEGLDDWSQRKMLYTHEQAVKSDTWTVVHNLGVFPSIQVFVTRPVSVSTEASASVPCELRNYEEATTELLEITPEDIRTVSVNEFVVEFDRPEQGTIQCIARSSKPVIINQPTEVVDEIQPFLLTKNSELTIATVDPVSSIEIEYIAPDGSVSSVVYNIISTPPNSTVSPWADATDGIFVNGTKYLTHSLDISDPSIVSGSSFYVNRINGIIFDELNFGKNELLFLLTAEPYEVVDKITDKFIDPFGIGSAEASTSFYYDDNEANAYDNLIESVYPSIRIL